MRQNIKLAVFDLDDTLAPSKRPAYRETIEKLLELEACGVQIAISSGKPTAYLTGVARQMGMKGPILVGECGLVYQIGIGQPPKEHGFLMCSETAKHSLKAIKEALVERFGEQMWFQKNELSVTPFPKDVNEAELVRAFLKAYVKPEMEIQYNDYGHCFDIFPVGADKGVSLCELAEKLGVSIEQVAAIGDGINDVPMLRRAGISVSVKKVAGVDVTYQAEGILDAMDYLLRLAGQNSLCDA